jgi:hypothetical protein
MLVPLGEQQHDLQKKFCVRCVTHALLGAAAVCCVDAIS